MKNRLLLLGCLLIGLLYGCAKKKEYAVKFNPNDAVSIDTTAYMYLSAGAHNILYPVNGVNRKFIVQLPTGFDASQTYPVVFGFHGTSTAYTDMRDEIGSMLDSRGYIGIYPAAATGAFNMGLTAADTLNDTAFVKLILYWLAQHTNVSVNAARCYATGTDAGGAFAHYLGLYTDLFAAIAPISASLPTGMMDNAIAGLHTAVMQIHGDADEAIPYGGGTGLLSLNWESAQNSIKYWAAHNTCGSEPTTGAVTSNITMYSYPVFVGAKESILVVVAGADVIYESADKDFLNSMIGDFFARNSK